MYTKTQFCALFFSFSTRYATYTIEIYFQTLNSSILPVEKHRRILSNQGHNLATTSSSVPIGRREKAQVNSVIRKIVELLETLQHARVSSYHQVLSWAINRS